MEWIDDLLSDFSLLAWMVIGAKLFKWDLSWLTRRPYKYLIGVYVLVFIVRVFG